MAKAVDIRTLEIRAAELDDSDQLAKFRNEFHIPLDEQGKPEIYFVGNSLGLQPKQTEAYLLEELESWKNRGVRGHFEGEHPWMPYHEFLAGPMAKIVGAQENEVVMMNGLTTNLHLMLATFYRPEDQRTKILIEGHAFPSDHFAVESQLRWNRLDYAEHMICLHADDTDHLISTDKILQAIDYFRDSIAVIMLPGVQYYTGQVFDIPAIVDAAHEHGIIAGFDLAHAAGNVELRLHDWDVDFAVWCSYKYLNSGPGSVAGCFVHDRHVKNRHLNRLAGWWGSDKETRFKMDNEFKPIPTAEGWQLSNPPILSMAAVRASLDLFDQAGIESLVRKSKRLTGFLIECLNGLLGDKVNIVTPVEEAQRGCQLSLEINLQNVDGNSVHQRLEQSGVRTDWREPNVIRAAPVPFYNSFADVVEFTKRLKAALQAD